MARTSTTAGDIATRVLVGLAVAVLVLVVGVPLLLAWWLSSPEPAPSAEHAGTMDRLRDVAYVLRDERVRHSLDRGAGLAEVAKVIGSTPMSRAQVRAAAAPGDAQLALIGVHAVGRSGIAVDLVQSRIPTGQDESFFAREGRPWVGCYRVELPVLAIDTTAWTARDVTCPTFSDALQRADRVHVDHATARPLLRPPCYGTTGYCPGG